MAFDVELQGHHFETDGDRKFGGENRGPSPKLLLLAGLAGCAGMDVVAIQISISGTYSKVTM